MDSHTCTHGLFLTQVTLSSLIRVGWIAWAALLQVTIQDSSSSHHVTVSSSPLNPLLVDEQILRDRAGNNILYFCPHPAVSESGLINLIVREAAEWGSLCAWKEDVYKVTTSRPRVFNMGFMGCQNIFWLHGKWIPSYPLPEILHILQIYM